MLSINEKIQSVTAFAPATCANVAVGFDILGFSFSEVGDHVTLTRRNNKQIVIESIKTVHEHETLPLNPEKNTASYVLQKISEGLKLDFGFSMQIKKGIPLSSGMGGSAASAVAALIALNAFLKTPLSLHELARYALFGEEIASGQQHADNIVPCLFGGLTLIQSRNPINIIRLPVPKLYCVLIHPHLQISTQHARAILKEHIPLHDYVKQSANLAAFISALYEKNFSLLQKTLTDYLIEPQRAQLLPGFYQIKQGALHAGALGVSFSGSGPTLFAFAKCKKDAEKISVVMRDQLTLLNIDSDCWIAPISKYSAHVQSIKQGEL